MEHHSGSNHSPNVEVKMAEPSLHDLFIYDESAPSCLRHKRTPKNRRVLAGDPAGNIVRFKNGQYWAVKIGSKQILAHRVIWMMHKNVQMKTEQLIDHRDGNGLNNRITNLRIADKAINGRNMRKKINCSIVCGVSFRDARPHKGASSAYVAYVTDLKGCRKTRQFSTMKYGKEPALAMAKSWRDEQISLLNESGAGYTDRHGK